MKLNYISLCILYLSWVLYDLLGTDMWKTNIVIVYMVIFYGYVLFNVIREALKAKGTTDKIIFGIMAFPLITLIGYELSAWGMTRDEYYQVTQSSIIDLARWIALVISLLGIILWANLKQYHI